VRCRVEQAEQDVGAGARGLRAEGGVAAADLRGPLVDVGALQGAHPLAGLVGQVAPVAVLDHDQRPVLEGELDVPLDERLEGLAGAAGGRDPRAPLGQERLADGHEHLREHRVLGLEVLVERGARDAARRAELGDRHAVEPPRGEEVGSDVEDLLAAGSHDAEVSAC
jgi:hypothetical protein